MNVPETKYARSGEVNIAYQVVGNGPIDLVFSPGAWNNIELVWETPPTAHFLSRLASFSRLIVFDHRGAGGSDRGAEGDSLEERMQDLRAVLDAADSKRAAVLGAQWGGMLAILFAATYPERTTSLILLSTFARLQPGWVVDGRGSWSPEDILETVRRDWGEAVLWDSFAPSIAHSRQARNFYARWLRLTTSATNAVGHLRAVLEADLTAVLGSVRVPTLVLHRSDDVGIDVRHARLLAERIPGARLVEFEGRDNMYWAGDIDPVLNEIEEFLTGALAYHEPDRVLASILFTDIVGSTERAARLGDRRWKGILDAHNAAVRAVLARFRGREIDTAGDGFMVTFDGPARAIHCAVEIARAVRAVGLEIRAGLHTGEIELAGNDIRGIAVHIGARVTAIAGPGEVLVSSTVKDLVAGSGIEFEDRGTHQLKGVPDEWRLFAVKG